MKVLGRWEATPLNIAAPSFGGDPVGPHLRSLHSKSLRDFAARTLFAELYNAFVRPFSGHI